MADLVPIEVAQGFLPGDGGALRPENTSMFQTILRGATRTVINRTRRNFTVEPAFDSDGMDTGDPVTKSFIVDTNGSARIPDLRALTSVVYGGQTVTSEAYELTPAPSDDYPFVFIDLLFNTGHISPYVTRPSVAITGRWGITPLPDDILVAICMLAARMFAKRDARWADQVQAGIESAAFNYYRNLPDEIKIPIEELRVQKIGLV